MYSELQVIAYDIFKQIFGFSNTRKENTFKEVIFSAKVDVQLQYNS